MTGLAIYVHVKFNTIEKKLLLSIIVFFCMLFLLIAGLLKSSDAYKIAVEKASNEARVVALLGTPISEGFMPAGSIQTSGTTGKASLLATL